MRTINQNKLIVFRPFVAGRSFRQPEASRSLGANATEADSVSLLLALSELVDEPSAGSQLSLWLNSGLSTC